MVVGKLRLRKAPHWIKWFYWHTQCWIEQALVALQKRPLLPAIGRGRKSFVPKELKIERLRLLRRRAYLLWKLRKYEGREDKILPIEKELEEVDKLLALQLSVSTTG